MCTYAAISAKCVLFVKDFPKTKQDTCCQKPVGRMRFYQAVFFASWVAEVYQHLIVPDTAVPLLWIGCSKDGYAVGWCPALAAGRAGTVLLGQKKGVLIASAYFLKNYSEQSLHVLAQLKHEVSKDLEAGVQLSALMPIKTFHCGGCVSCSSLIKLANCPFPKWGVHCQTSWKAKNNVSLFKILF